MSKARSSIRQSSEVPDQVSTTGFLWIPGKT